MAGHPKPVKPMTTGRNVTNEFYVGEPAIGYGRIEACAPAKCAYCGRYGSLGQCQGCGAANRPETERVPTLPLGDVWK